jgi:hypothetical protein
LSHRYNRDIKTGPAPARVELSAPYNLSILQPGPVEAKLLMAYHYDMESEISKKKFLLQVFNKTSKEEDEESVLKLELKKIELQIKKITDNKSLMSSKGQQQNMKTLRGRKNITSKPTNQGSSSGTNLGVKSNVAGVGGIGAGYGHSDVGSSVLHPARMGPLTTDAPVYLRSVRLLSESTPAALLPSRGNANAQAAAAAAHAAAVQAGSVPPFSSHVVDTSTAAITTTSIGHKMLYKMNMVGAFAVAFGAPVAKEVDADFFFFSIFFCFFFVLF